MDSLDDLLLQQEYAQIRRCSERTIERERTAGTGCPFVKIGRIVRYRRRDILDFIERHVRRSTSAAVIGRGAAGGAAGAGVDVAEQRSDPDNIGPVASPAGVRERRSEQPRAGSARSALAHPTPSRGGR
jgi:hypothetical protein